MADTNKVHKSHMWVAIYEDEIVFMEPAPSGFGIKLSKIKTQAELLDWIHHMSYKSWITPLMIRQFIEQIYAHYDWELYKVE